MGGVEAAGHLDQSNASGLGGTADGLMLVQHVPGPARSPIEGSTIDEEGRILTRISSALQIREVWSSSLPVQSLDDLALPSQNQQRVLSNRDPAAGDLLTDSSSDFFVLGIGREDVQLIPLQRDQVL